jgi:hypothetical protein
MNKRIAFVGGVIIVLLGLVWFFLLRGPSTAVGVDNPNGFRFVCENGHEFTLTESDLRDYKAHHLGEPIRCPKCGNTKVRQAENGPRATGASGRK